MSVPVPTFENPPALEIAACPLCGARDALPVARLHDAVWAKPGQFGLVRCTACSLAFLSPRPPRESIGFYYKDLYDGEGLVMEEKLQHSAIARALNRFRLRDLVSRRRPSVGDRHLDVGCGVGAFLLRVSRDTGATGVGVDFDPAAIESTLRHGRDAGLPIEAHRGTLDEQTFAPGEFATVSMIHFLEHSYDPRAELVLARDLLAPGGAIVVEVPSFRSVARRVFGAFWLPYLAPQHVTLFDRVSLKHALEESGFRDVRVGDSWAPFIWTTSFILWYHATLGGRSRFAENKAVKMLSLFLAFTLLPTLAVVDVLGSVVAARVGRGEHIRATAVKA